VSSASTRVRRKSSGSSPVGSTEGDVVFGVVVPGVPSASLTKKPGSTKPVKPRPPSTTTTAATTAMIAPVFFFGGGGGKPPP